MAQKDKITKSAVRCIVELKDDEHKNYSYEDIVSILKEKFDIEVSKQAVGYHYRKNKDKDLGQPVTSSLNDKIRKLGAKSVTEKTDDANEQTVFVKQNLTKAKEFEQISEDDFKNLLKGD